MRGLFSLVAFSVIVFLCVSCADDTGFQYPESKIWAHRVNNPDDANIKIKNFKGIEIDLIYNKATGQLVVSHDQNDINKQITFRQYLQRIKKPNELYYWLDVKNLIDNTEAICDTINHLAEVFQFKDRFFVESWYAVALSRAKEKGITTSLWIDNLYDMKDMDTLKWLDNARHKISIATPDALSAEYRMWRLLVDYFPDNNIHLWHTPADYSEDNAKLTREMCHDSHVKVVLVDYDKPISY